MKIQPGRPKKNRRLESDEVRDPSTGKVRLKSSGVCMTYSMCKEHGHNRAGCPKRRKHKQTQATEPAANQAQTESQLHRVQVDHQPNLETQAAQAQTRRVQQINKENTWF